MPLGLRAATNDLTAALQKGLFEEEANRNLDAAVSNYQSLAAQFDQDRQVAATAIFRLGECYRKLGQTNDAVVQYQRILRDFSDQKTLATLSRQNLTGLGAASQPNFQERLVATIKRNPQDANASTATDPAARASELEAEAASLKTQIEQLSGLKREDRRITVQQNFSNPVLTSLMQQLNEAEQKLAGLTNDYALQDMHVVRATALVNAINGQIDTQVEGAIKGLQTKMETDLNTAKTLRAQAGSVPATHPPATTVVTDDEEQEIRRIQAMIQNSPDLINGNASQGSPLGRAAQAGRLRVAEFLLDNGADVNAPTDSTGRTPLNVAAEAGHKTMVELLLKRGANVNAANGQGETALHQAVEQGFISVAEVLLAAKADPNRQNEDTQTPLAIAARKGSRSIAALLLAHGADPNIARKVHPGYGTNPLSEGRKMFGTPLHIAAAHGDTELVALLLTNRADVKTMSIYSETPLQVAAACGKAAVAELLLAAGADPNARTDADASTPLNLATSDGYRDVVERLLAHGAKPDATACIIDRDNIRHDNVTPLILAATGGYDDIVLLLLQRKANPNLKDDSGYTALIRAIEAKKVAVAKALLAHGADPEAKGGEWPALMMAAGRHNPEITSALLTAGANVNVAAGGQQQTALHEASNQGDLKIVQILLAAHANPNLADANGDTPLHLAVRNGRDEVVQLLLDAKADPNIRNHSGSTALDYAKKGPRNTATPGRRLGGGPRLPGAPLSYQWNNSAQPESPATNSLANLLRQHGALDNLPDWNCITVSRPAANFSFPIFQKSTNDWNHFTLLEMLLDFVESSQMYSIPEGNGATAFYGLKSMLPLPDLTHVSIVRPSRGSTNVTRTVVNLLNSTNGIDCAKDVLLAFGDVVEIPEREHSLAEAQVFLTQEQKQTLWRHFNDLAGEAKLVVAGGRTVQLPLQPLHSQIEAVLWRDDARAALTSNSDLSRVKVIRHDVKTGKKFEWVLDCSGDHAPDLWLRDGDVIEVPEK